MKNEKKIWEILESPLQPPAGGPSLPLPMDPPNQNTGAATAI